MRAHRVHPWPSRALHELDGEAGRGRLLLVLMFVLQLCHTSPIDFICSAEARNKLNIVKTLQNKMFQQRGALVLAPLLGLKNAVGFIRNRTELQCQASILQLLEHNIHNHILILRDLYMQEAPGPPEERCQARYTTSFHDMIHHYELVRRQIEFFVKNYRNSCSRHGMSYVTQQQ